MKNLHEYEHPYYCSDTNFYSNEPNAEYETVEDFMDDWKDYDIDMNLIFRWDVFEDEETGNIYAKVYYMLQRKGIFKPIYIKSFNIEKQTEFIEFLKPHWERLKEMWNPISKEDEK